MRWTATWTKELEPYGEQPVEADGEETVTQSNLDTLLNIENYPTQIDTTFFEDK